MKKALYYICMVMVSAGIVVALAIILPPDRETSETEIPQEDRLLMETLPGTPEEIPDEQPPVREAPAPDMPETMETPAPEEASPESESPGNPEETDIQEETDVPEKPDESTTTDEPAVTENQHPGPAATGSNMSAARMELPVEGSTGWAAVAMKLREEPRTDSTTVLKLETGRAFTVEQEQGQWWYVRLGDGKTGWVDNRMCFINLPDVIPSIVYNITNAYSSLKRSAGFDIPNVTSLALYDARAYNPRLDSNEFIVPMLYSTACKIYNVQQTALADGNTLVIYEAFRPRATQQRVANNLKKLMESNETVYNAINTSPWSINWFISGSVSNHQRGAAADVNLGRIISRGTGHSGAHTFTRIVGYEEYAMPTAMHELSSLAAAFKRPVSTSSRDAWRSAAPADSMTDGAKLMQQYFDSAGFTPIASEWWHFNDLDGKAAASGYGITGEFFTETIYSRLP